MLNKSIMPDQLLYAENMLQVRELFVEYAQSVGRMECFGNFEEELDELPGQYAPPDGRIILAYNGREPAGCVALRKIEEETCEMKRLYVRPQFRGKGLGKKLAQAIIEEARKIGYARMRLDTLSSLKEAIAMYRSLKFIDIPRYNDNDFLDVLFMELALR